MQLDLLFRNGVMLTGDRDRPRASQLGVWGGVIVGVDEQVEGASARRVIDLQGATVTPGFHDAHCHTAWFGLGLQSVNLARASTVEEVQDALVARAAITPRGQWVHGVNLDHNRIGRYPDRLELDAASADHPIAVRHTSGHAMVINSKALVLARLLDSHVVDPEGGRIVRDAAGTPTGVLEEQAQQIVQALILPRSIEDLVNGIDAAGRVYLREGITSTTEAGIGAGWVGHSAVEAAAYQYARDTGCLHSRTNLMVAADVLHPVSSHPDDHISLALDLGLRTGFGDSRLRLGAIKVFTDGSLLGRTALVTEPFCDYGGTGYLQRSESSAMDIVREAHRAGWQVALHAIGDAAVDLALDAVEAAQQASPRLDPRHRIEHAGMVRPEQMSRMAALGVVAVTQPGFVSAFGDAMAAAVGPERIPWTYRIASLVDSGIHVAGSSDRPVASGSPLRGIQAMVQRLTDSGLPFGPDEAVNAQQAIHHYTKESAYAVHMDHRIGSLEAGMLADLAILQEDPTELAPSRISSIPVLATVIGGEFVYDTMGFAIDQPSLITSASASDL